MKTRLPGALWRVQQAVKTITYTHKRIAPRCYYVLIHPCSTPPKPHRAPQTILGGIPLYNPPAPLRRTQPKTGSHHGCPVWGWICDVGGGVASGVTSAADGVNVMCWLDNDCGSPGLQKWEQRHGVNPSSGWYKAGDIATWLVGVGDGADEVRGVEELQGVGSSAYIDLTRRGSVRNIGTDVTETQFARNLMRHGWKPELAKDGTQLFFKDGAKYSIRREAKSYDGWTAEFTPQGSIDATLKIRLGVHR